MYYRGAAAAIVVYDITNQVFHPSLLSICLRIPLLEPRPGSRNSRDVVTPMSSLPLLVTRTIQRRIVRFLLKKPESTLLRTI